MMTAGDDDRLLDYGDGRSVCRQTVASMGEVGPYQAHQARSLSDSG